MSKIFDALKQNRSDAPDLVLGLLNGQPEPEPPPPAKQQTARPSEAPPAPEPRPPVVPVMERTPAGLRTLPVSVESKAPLFAFDEHTPSAEQYRIARTKILQHPKQPRMIVVSSACPGDGKSITALNLAAMMSLKDEDGVLLLDTDFRRSRTNTRLGWPGGPGLADVLAGKCVPEEAIVRVQQFPNLYVLPPGVIGSKGSEMLDSNMWAPTCARLRKMFHYIVVDAPPIGSVADYDVLEATCDGIVLVLRQDYSDRTFCLKALTAMESGKFIGIILNCVRDTFLTKLFLHNAYYAYYSGAN